MSKKGNKIIVAKFREFVKERELMVFKEALLDMFFTYLVYAAKEGLPDDFDLFVSDLQYFLIDVLNPRE